MTTKQDHSGPFTIPREGSKTRAVWDMCDELKGKGITTRREVLAESRSRGMASGTASCQVPRWEHNNQHFFESKRKGSKKRKPMAGRVSSDAEAVYKLMRHEILCEDEYLIYEAAFVKAQGEYAEAKAKWVSATKSRKEVLK